MILDKFPEIQRLSPTEKLQFVAELWNELEANPSAIPVSPEILSELDRRMKHFQANPAEFTTWDSVKQKILGSHK